MGYSEPAHAANGRLLDVGQLAEYLGLTERQIRHMVETEQIPVTRFNRRVMFDVVAIDRWLARQTSKEVA